MIDPPASAAKPVHRHIDVCNGDADGLCAVLQWRLAEPVAAELVTGLKRDIELLDRVQAGAGDRILVCDLSLRRNCAALLRLLESGAQVTYFDHHAAGEVPRHPRLQAHLDMSPDICTSLLVDRHLRGRHRAWALVGAYGDNLGAVADALAAEQGFDSAQRSRLRRLGEAINYNAYGDVESDVLIAPARLYRILARYPDPLELLARETIVDAIDARRRADLDRARGVGPWRECARGRVWLLPDADWSRRAGGSLANVLAVERPDVAHAVIRSAASGGLVVSVRAPLLAPAGAERLCAHFGGSGRAAAAGIDHLPCADLERFVAAFAAMRWGGE